MKIAIHKTAALVAKLTNEAKLALSGAKFDGCRWILSTSAIETVDELRGLKLVQGHKPEIHVTLSGMNVRAALARASRRHGAVSE